MKNIEVEIKTFISKEKYEELLEFFRKNGKLIKEEHQETHYMNTQKDLRLQKSNSSAKIWLKSGKIHDEMREEIEVFFDKKDFPKMQHIFHNINIHPEIKWFRDRKQFDWENIIVSLDYTKGYGYILELEKMCSEEEKLKALEELKEKIKQFNLPITPIERFNERFEYYKENWRNLVEE